MAEALRDVIMERLDDYFGDGDEEDPCGECRDVEELEAAMLAIIQELREQIAMLKARITELEKRPQVFAEPVDFYPNITTTFQFDGNSLTPSEIQNYLAVLKY